jgi:hypothetical protein
MEYSRVIEMQTINRKDKGVSQDEPSNIPLFKILMETKCAKAKTSLTIRKIRYTSIILRQGEIYSGNVIIHKNRIYIDITECYNHKTEHGVCRDISIYIPVIFDTTGKYMMNVCEYS